MDGYTAFLGDRKEKKLKLENWNFKCKCDICLQPDNDLFLDSISLWLKTNVIFGDRKEKKLKLENWNFKCKCDICLQPDNDLFLDSISLWLKTNVIFVFNQIIIKSRSFKTSGTKSKRSQIIMP